MFTLNDEIVSFRIKTSHQDFVYFSPSTLIKYGYRAWIVSPGLNILRSLPQRLCCQPNVVKTLVILLTDSNQIIGNELFMRLNDFYRNVSQLTFRLGILCKAFVQVGVLNFKKSKTKLRSNYAHQSMKPSKLITS